VRGRLLAGWVRSSRESRRAAVPARAATGEGKDRRGDYQGTLADASSRKHPGLGGFPGWQGPAAERRQAAAAHASRPVGTVVPGVERAPGPVRVSCVRNVETLLWVRITGAGMRR